MIKFCDNLKCNKSPLKIKKDITLYQNKRKIYVPDIEYEICPICGKEFHSFEAMEKREEALEQASKEKAIFKNRIKKAREEKGWSQEELGKVFKVSKQRISSIENGKANSQGLTILQALQLSEILEKPIDELWYLEYVSK
jgi:putative transcriptional regulator